MTDQEDEIKRIRAKIAQKKKKKPWNTLKKILPFILLVVIFAGIINLTSRPYTEIKTMAEEGFPTMEGYTEKIAKKPIIETKLESVPGSIKTTSIPEASEQTRKGNSIKAKKEELISKKEPRELDLGFRIEIIEDPETGIVLEKVIPNGK